MRHARMISEADLSCSNDSRLSQSAKSESHLNEIVSSFATQLLLPGLVPDRQLYLVLAKQRRRARRKPHEG